MTTTVNTRSRTKCLYLGRESRCTTASIEKDILLAEDDMDDFLIFRLALEETKIPYIFRHTATAKMLYNLLKERVPEILFLDVYMPCDDGVSCLTEIRKNKAYDNLPIVMFTGNVKKKTIDECYQVGANLYMSKSSSLTDMTLNLKSVLSIDWLEHRKNHSPDNFILS